MVNLCRIAYAETIDQIETQTQNFANNGRLTAQVIITPKGFAAKTAKPSSYKSYYLECLLTS